MKVSEITISDIANYMRLDDYLVDYLAETSYLTTILNVSKEYIKSYTGLTDLDLYDDFVIAIYVLCQDMYDNRAYYVDNDKLNKVVETILNMHSVNLL